MAAERGAVSLKCWECEMSSSSLLYVLLVIILIVVLIQLIT